MHVCATSTTGLVAECTDLYRFTAVSRSTSSVCYLSVPPSTAGKSGGPGELGSFFVLMPGPIRSPFSNERQVSASAANGKLKRVKTCTEAGGS